MQNTQTDGQTDAGQSDPYNVAQLGAGDIKKMSRIFINTGI